MDKLGLIDRPHDLHHSHICGMGNKHIYGKPNLSIITSHLGMDMGWLYKPLSLIAHQMGQELCLPKGLARCCGLLGGNSLLNPPTRPEPDSVIPVSSWYIQPYNKKVWFGSSNLFPSWPNSTNPLWPTNRMDRVQVESIQVALSVQLNSTQPDPFSP